MKNDAEKSLIKAANTARMGINKMAEKAMQMHVACRDTAEALDIAIEQMEKQINKKGEK